MSEDSLRSRVVEEFRARLLDESFNVEIAYEAVNDVLGDIADEACPVYNGDIMDTVANDPNIMHREVDVPAFDGEMTPINVCAAAIYEHFSEIASSVLYDLKVEAAGIISDIENSMDINEATVEAEGLFDLLEWDDADKMVPIIIAALCDFDEEEDDDDDDEA